MRGLKSKFNLALTAMIALSSLVSVSADAAVDLFLWRAIENHPAFILPVPSTTTPEKAARAYIEKMQSDPELSKLLPEGSLRHLHVGDFSKLKASDTDVKALLIANDPSDYVSGARRVKLFAKGFAQANTQAFLLPIAADTTLSPTHAREFRQAVIDHFPLLVPMGGDDVDPKRYGRKNSAAANINTERDRSEIALIRAFDRAARGFIFGICRGSQITAAALGYKLVQHIENHRGSTPATEFSNHDIEILDTKTQMLAKIAGGLSRIQVNSAHHQAIEWPKDDSGPLVPAARADDGTLEAMEFKNGRGLLLQFHPEYMRNWLSGAVFNFVSTASKRLQIGSCQASFQNKAHK